MISTISTEWFIHKICFYAKITSVRRPLDLETKHSNKLYTLFLMSPITRHVKNTLNLYSKYYLNCGEILLRIHIQILLE